MFRSCVLEIGAIRVHLVAIPVRGKTTLSWNPLNSGGLSVKSPAIILFENSGVSLAKNQLKIGKNRLKSAKVGQSRARHRLKLAKNRQKKERFSFHS